MTDVERLREELYALCGRRVACKRAAEYYIMSIQNPCYPPADKMTYRMRKFYMEILEKYGLPPRCDVKALVLERLRGTALEKYAHEVAELAELLKRGSYITSRVAAAAAAIAVAERRGVAATRGSVAALFGTSYNAARMYVKNAYKLYSEYILRRGA
jgi:hypothetical protein